MQDRSPVVIPPEAAKLPRSRLLKGLDPLVQLPRLLLAAAGLDEHENPRAFPKFPRVIHWLYKYRKGMDNDNNNNRRDDNDDNNNRYIYI